MIERYTRPEMGHLWSIQNEWQTILNVEIAACEAMAELGEIPAAAVENIKAKAKFDVARINEIEKTTDHDIIAFLTNLEENIGEDSKYIHKGLTSSDVKDTAYCVMMRDAAAIILDDLQEFRTVLRRRANEFRHTPCIGRTHGIHAEPMTFGLKLLLWSAEIERDIERLTHAKKIVSVGKLSGAVGTYLSYYQQPCFDHSFPRYWQRLYAILGRRRQPHSSRKTRYRNRNDESVLPARTFWDNKSTYQST